MANNTVHHTASEDETQVQDAARCYINQLPFELLSDIFTICGHAYEEDGKEGSIHASPTCASILCCVSNRWMAVAFGTPALWTRVRVVGPQTMERALVWAKHCQNHDLDVSIALDDYWADTAAAINRFEPYFARIAALELDVISQNTSPEEVTFFKHIPNTIRRLRLSNMWFWNGTRLLDFLATCESLNYLDVSSCTGREAWLSLAEIELSRPHWISLLELEEIVLPPNPLADHIRKYVVAPRLKLVSLRGHGFARCRPNSLELQIVPFSNQPGLDNDILEFLFGLVPEVESLAIDWENADDDAISLYPSILFHLGECPTDFPHPNASLSEEEWIPAEQVALPRLRTLQLLNVTERSGVRHLLSRLPLIAYGRAVPLQKIEAHGRCEPDGWAEVGDAFRAQGTIVEAVWADNSNRYEE